jgi:hypothetical protein
LNWILSLLLLLWLLLLLFRHDSIDCLYGWIDKVWAYVILKGGTKHASTSAATAWMDLQTRSLRNNMEQVFISTKNRPNMQKNPRNLILPSILVYFRRRNVDVDMASTKGNKTSTISKLWHFSCVLPWPWCRPCSLTTKSRNACLEKWTWSWSFVIQRQPG